MPSDAPFVVVFDEDSNIPTAYRFWRGELVSTVHFQRTSAARPDWSRALTYRYQPGDDRRRYLIGLLHSL